MKLTVSLLSPVAKYQIPEIVELNRLATEKNIEVFCSKDRIYLTHFGRHSFPYPSKGDLIKWINKKIYSAFNAKTW